LQRPEKYWFRAEEIYEVVMGGRDKSVKLKVVVMGVFMVKAEERESERALTLGVMWRVGAKDRPRVFWGMCMCARTWWGSSTN
jgi:hypothetical protein